METSNNIRVALVDDHDLFREGMGTIIARMEHIELVMEASNGIELLKGLESTPVDVILMDLEMKEMDGIEASKQVPEKFPDVKILVLTMHNQDRMISYMMESGVHGYLLKNTRKEELEEAIRKVHEKGFYFNDKTSGAMLSSLRKKKATRPSFNYSGYLTSREQEVLVFICKGMTMPEIGEQLFISHRTVEGHRQSLMNKLNVKNTAGLVVKAIRENLVTIM